MAGLITNINLNLSGVYSDADIFTGVAPKFNLSKVISATLQSGTSNSQNRYLYANTLTLSTSPTTIDLYGFTDMFGDTVNGATVRWIFIHNLSTTTGENVIFGGSSATCKGWFSGTNPADIIPPGGFNMKYAPTGTVWGITNSSADVIAIASATGTPQCELVIGMV